MHNNVVESIKTDLIRSHVHEIMKHMVHTCNLIIIDAQNQISRYIRDPSLFVICNKFTRCNLEYTGRTNISTCHYFAPTFSIILNSLQNN